VKPWLFLLCLNFFKTSYSVAQPLTRTTNPTDSIQLTLDSSLLKEHANKHPNRVYLIAGVHAVGYAGTLLILSTAWYNGYAKTSFHTFNDNKEWLQMDKIGHAWTAYNIANYSSRLWQWSGLDDRKAALLGGFSALGYQTIIEFLDAHSAAWGWSCGDIGANTFGATLFTTQQLACGSQKIILKFSSFPQHYEASLRPRADALFGKSFSERLLKDYNGQNY